jgi:hypothetical protein
MLLDPLLHLDRVVVPRKSPEQSGACQGVVSLEESDRNLHPLLEKGCSSCSGGIHPSVLGAIE